MFGGGFKEGLEFESATPDLSHVVFDSQTDSPGLYEWTASGQPSCVPIEPSSPNCVLKPVGVLPGPAKTIEPKAFLGMYQGRDFNHAISSDGSRVIWSATKEGANHLYVRDTNTGEEETVQLDTFQPGLPQPAKPTADAAFQTASADGSKIFFTDTQRLTAESNALEGLPDLYVYELNVGSHPLTGTLRDLTPQSGAAVVGEIGNGVLGASEDGTSVYFVANGVLAPGASHGHCPMKKEVRPPGTRCNLYLLHFNGSEWEPAKLIATLSFEDVPDWDDLESGNLAYQTSQVSPNGQYVAFMSNRNLTGYEPIDASSGQIGGAPPGQHDEEVYLYDAATEKLTCASCNPTGARPHGVQDLGATDSGESAEGIGLVVDRPLTWAESVETQVQRDHWLAGSVPGWTSLSGKNANYQSRYLSNSGRLFFNSPDHLVPAATGEKEKVYEYEPGGVGSCATEGGCVALISGGNSEHEAAFLDASANGNDVFFLSAQALVPNPEDNFSVYDAHVCEPSSPCTPPPAKRTRRATKNPCRAEPHRKRSSRRWARPRARRHSVPATSRPRARNIGVLPSQAKSKPLTRAQKLAKALKACKKDKQKKKRVACEKAARKKYGPPAKNSSKKS